MAMNSQERSRALGELRDLLKNAGFRGTAVMDLALEGFRDGAASVKHWALRTGELPERFLMRPVNDVRKGPFYLGTNYTDNAALGNSDSLLTTMIDPVLLRGQTSATTANNSKLYNQCLIMTGYRLEYQVSAAEVNDDTKTAALVDVMASTGLYVKTATGAQPGTERYYSGAGANATFLSGSAVEDTNAATSVRTAHRILMPPRQCEPVSIYFKEDTFGVYHGAQVNTQANIKVLVHVEGLVLPWEWSDRRPGISGDDCEDGTLTDFFFRRMRAIIHPGNPLAQLG